MKDKEPTPTEIREALEYLRGQRDMPTSEIELLRNEMVRERNFGGCVSLLFAIVFAGMIGALAAGHPGGGMVLLTTAAVLGFLAYQQRKIGIEKIKALEELKRKKAGESSENKASDGLV